MAVEDILFCEVLFRLDVLEQRFQLLGDFKNFIS